MGSTVAKKKEFMPFPWLDIIAMENSYLCHTTNFPVAGHYSCEKFLLVSLDCYCGTSDDL